MQTRKCVIAALLLLISVFMASTLYPHCQIPCGIYDDPARLKLMAEHITTIEKSMTEITALSADPGRNANQLVRWVNNKESHVDQFAEIVTYYFMAQRIKPAAKTDDKAWPQYINQLTMLHDMLVTSMKCKQTVDLEHIAKLRQLLEAFEKAYLQKDAAADIPHTH
jgi:nickel superoxide dismutase